MLCDSPKVSQGFPSNARPSGFLYILDTNAHNGYLTPSICVWRALCWWFGMGTSFSSFSSFSSFFYLFLLPLFLSLFIWNKYWSFSQFDILYIGCLWAIVQFERRPVLASVSWPISGRGQGLRVWWHSVYCWEAGWEQEGCKLEWQALWLLSLHLNTRPLVWLGYVTFLNEAEVWLNCKPNLFFLSVKKQAETRRSKQETSSIGIVESYCSMITET